jgi:putative flippase GtrA
VKLSVREILPYAAGAAAAFAVDMATLAFLVEVLSVHYLIAASISFMAGTAVVYWISVTYAFAYRRVRRAGDEFAIFAMVGLAGILVNLAGMYLSVEWLHLHYLVGKVLSASVTFFTNFGLRRALLFTPWGQQDAQKRQESGG